MIKKDAPLLLGTENVWKLLIQYALPSVIAMTASSLYNITDSIFIGHGVGILAIAGLAITFPLMNLAAAFGSLVGVGASTLMSLRLGQKDYKSANYILGNVFTLNLLLGIFFSVLVLVYLDPILLFFGASESTLPYAHSYMFVIAIGNVITHMYMGLNALLRSTGKPKIAMYATIFTVIINAVLTPIFIFAFNWGIKGAAIATISSQVLMLIWQIRIFSNKNSFIHLQKGIYSLKKKIVVDSLSIGMSPFLMNAASSIIIIFLNQSLIKYGGDLAVGAYGIINRILFLFVMVVLGLTQGMQPIAGYNFGAKLYPRVIQSLKYTILLATLVTTLGFVIGEFFPEAIAQMFTKDKDLTLLVIDGTRIVFIIFPIVGFQIVTSNFFQSIGMPKKAIFLSLTRQVIFLLPFLFVFPYFWDLNGVWYSIPASDFFSSLLAIILLILQLKKFNKFS
jgi:putative MATE family efflux protein